MRTLTLSGLLLLVVACEPPDEVEPQWLAPVGTPLHAELLEAAEGAWLGGDRFALLSPGDNRIAILDFSSGSVNRLDPAAREIQNPGHLFSLADTLFVSDWGRRRVTAWTGGTTLVREIPLSPLAGGALPQAVDAHGALYFEVSPNPGPDGSGNRDSAAVVRVTPGAVKADTLARLTPLELAAVETNQGRRFERRVFSGDDEWGVLPDGTLWVARYYHNRVDWRDTTGTWHTGAGLPDRVLEVTRVDRERFAERFPPELRDRAQQLQYNPVKPAFVKAFTGAGGHVWLEKSRHIADTMQTYHEVGRDGQLLRELRVAGWGRLLATSDSAALVVRTDTVGFTVTMAR